jgi:hypothetical protein
MKDKYSCEAEVSDEYRCPKCGKWLLVIYKFGTNDVAWVTCVGKGCYFGESIEDWNKRKIKEIEG